LTTRRPAKNAFNLIEMLAAISIMVILAAMILPAVQYWRSGARAMKSLHNGRQLGAAAAAYAAEHRGLLPTTDWSSWPDPSGYRYWVEEIVPYVYGETRKNSSGQTMVDGTFRCPGLRGHQLRGDRWYRWEWNEVDWINVSFRKGDSGWLPSSTLTCDNTKTPFLVSSDKNNGTTGLYEGEQGMFATYVPPSVWIYNKGVIVTYLDGHAEIVREPNSTNIFKK